MNKEIILKQVKDVEKRLNSKNLPYVRVKFEASDIAEQKTITVKTSMSLDQWEDLKNKMHIALIDGVLITDAPQQLTVDTEEMNNAGNKLLWKRETGNHQGNNFDYYEMSAGVLIMNNIIRKTDFVKDYAGLI